MGCTLSASAFGCLVAMLWLLLPWLLLVWVALLVTNVGLVMPLLGELGTTLALLSVWLAGEVGMADMAANWQGKLLMEPRHANT